MKKIILSAAVVLSLTFAASAQTTTKKADVTICKSSKASYSVADLQKCNMVLPTNESLKVKSFTISFLVKGDDGKSVYLDYVVNGNNISQEALDGLNKVKGKVSKMIIEKVVAVDVNKKESPLNGMTAAIN